jgi:hypothetical protein
MRKYLDRKVKKLINKGYLDSYYEDIETNGSKK